MTEAELEPQQKNLWLKGVSAYQLKNLDYAVSLIINVVKQSPQFLDGRKLLRRAEADKVKGQKKGLFGGGLNFGGLKFGGGGSKKEPWEAIGDLEENVFQKDPYNIAANQQLYDLAMRLGQHDLAAFALETIREGHPENTRNSHALAIHYMAHDQPEKASDVYRAITKIDPTDMDAVKGEKDAAAKTSMLRQGWQGGNADAAKKDRAEAQALENAARQGMTREQQETLLGQYFVEYEKDQNNVNVVKKIADLYDRMDEQDNALPYFEWALQLNPADVALANRVEQVRNKIGERQIAAMEAEIEANPDAPDLEEKRAQIRAIKQERSATLLVDAKSKVERNPTDKQYRFDLAAVLFQCEQYREAIPELQQAKGNPHIRNKALLMLGKCFAALNMNDLAVNSYGDAVKEILSFTNEKKELLYELGVVYEKMGRKDDYLNCMKEIYNNDYGYRDVAKRVESSYS